MTIFARDVNAGRLSQVVDLGQHFIDIGRFDRQPVITIPLNEPSGSGSKPQVLHLAMLLKSRILESVHMYCWDEADVLP